MKILKVEAVYLAERRTFEDAAADSPAFIDTIYNAARRIRRRDIRAQISSRRKTLRNG